MPKRYEIMTKEQMLKFVEECQVRFCNECPAYGGYNGTSYIECCVAYLKAEVSKAEVTMKKRWQIIKSDKDLMRMREEFWDFCRGKHCRECKFGEIKISEDCFVKYLCQEIEVTS